MSTTKKQLIADTIELIKVADSKDVIEKITHDFCLELARMSKAANSYNNPRTEFIKAIRDFENVPENLKSEYKNYMNHHAITKAYEYNHAKMLAELENEKSNNTDVLVIENTTNLETEKTQKTPKKAVTLDAHKLIDLAISWLDSDDFYLIGIGVALLTGRRQSEIYFYTTFKADDEYTMILQYLSKKRGENYNKQFRIPVLCNSDLIENAVEKIRKLAPMTELLEIINNSKNIELGLKTARDKFNNCYSSQILKIYNSEARNYFQDCENKELGNDKDYFHGIRATYASIFYQLIQDKYQCSVNDCINYVKHCLSHDTDGIAQKYTEFRFKNLPSVDDLDDSIFSVDNICEVPVDIKEDVKIELNISDLLQKLDINSQNELSKKLASGENIQSVLATFIMKGTQAMIVSQAVGKGEETNPKTPDTRDKIGNIVLAMIQYNHNQESIENPDNRVYYAINASSIDNVSKFLTGKNIDRVTLKNTCNNLKSKINDCHKSLKLSEKLASRKNSDGIAELANYHVRGDKNSDKLKSVLNSIKAIYESQYNL
jgi:hypothetical protein